LAASILSAPIWAEICASTALYAAVEAGRKSAGACLSLLGEGLDDPHDEVKEGQGQNTAGCIAVLGQST
jgi:hypothetical protein